MDVRQKKVSISYTLLLLNVVSYLDERYEGD